MNDYTPTTEEVRELFLQDTLPGERNEAGEQFDRWLADHDRTAKAEGWDEGLDAGSNYYPMKRDYEDMFLDIEPEPPANPYREQGATAPARVVPAGDYKPLTRTHAAILYGQVEKEEGAVQSFRDFSEGAQDAILGLVNSALRDYLNGGNHER